ncbi:AhpD-like protein [Abortiporus biennis]|nr:AhpD-like protein [Abortiporus biennis]
MLRLNAPQIASTWNDLANVIRDNNTIPAQMRELMILRSGVVNNAAYVWLQHEPVARSTGLTTAQLLEIRMTPAFLGPLTPKSTLSKELQAALLFADWSSKNVHVPQPVFNGLKQFLNNKQIVEAVSTVGFYNFVSRFVVSLNVDGKMDTAVPIPS